MTRMIFAAAALALATPALADQPTTTLEVRKHFAADDGGNEGVIFTGGSGITEKAARIHAGIAARSNQGNPTLDPTVAELLDDDSIANETAAMIFETLEDEEPAGAVN